jgi:NAD(P)-dependent dehydrogenase (short-subunit alcohol dehydrogenase family)
MPQQIWIVVGATRGIGLEFTRQLLAQNHVVIATARSIAGASQLWPLTGRSDGHNLKILECDVSDEGSIKTFTEEVRKLGRKGSVLEGGVIHCVVLNAGILVYPNRISEM